MITTPDDILLINSHRKAVGRRPIIMKSDVEEVRRHLELITLFAPYGVDPWASYSASDIITLSEVKPNDHLKGGEVYTAASRTLKTAMEFLKLKAPELVLTKSGENEYRVNKRGGREATAYYTNDLADALATGIAMSKKGVW